MADIKSRILGWDETQIVNPDDFVLIDGNTAGTRRYNINRIGGGATLVELTQEEYDALSEEEKNASDKLYFITDGGSPSPGGEDPYMITNAEKELDDTSMSGYMEISDVCQLTPITGYTPVAVIDYHIQTLPDHPAYIVNKVLNPSSYPHIGFTVKNIGSSSFSNTQMTVYFTILWKKNNN